MHKATVADVLRQAGIELRDRRKLPPVERLGPPLRAGETAAQIAATYGAQPEAVYRAMEAAGIERRPAGARGRPLHDDDVVACYVNEGLSLRATARRLDVTILRVREAVDRLGVLRSPFDPASIDRRRFSRRYAAGATYGELGAEFGLTEHQVTRAIRTFELPARQPGTRRPLLISDRQLASLVAAGYSDVDIARRYDVAVWAVVRRRREEPGCCGRRRTRFGHRSAEPDWSGSSPPVSAGPRSPPPTASGWPPSPAGAPTTGSRWSGRPDLQAAEASSSTLANCDGCTSPSNGRHARSPTSSASTQHWSTSRCTPIGSRCDTAATAPKTTPWCCSTPSTPTPTSPPRSGATTSRCALGPARWPDDSRNPAPLAAELAEELYSTLGLSTIQISLLTGHTASNVLEVLRRHGIPSRPGSRSPWYERTLM